MTAASPCDIPLVDALAPDPTNAVVLLAKDCGEKQWLMPRQDQTLCQVAITWISLNVNSVDGDVGADGGQDERHPAR